MGFVEQLAEGTPLPGGGCAVALAGALAAALGALAARIIARREADPGSRQSLEELLAGLTRHQQSFLELIDADALAYHGVVEARRQPRRSPGETAARQELIARAYLQACEPPEQMARQGLDLLDWAITLAGAGNPVVQADVGVMGFLAAAVVRGALVNIASNLAMAGDRPEAAARRAAARDWQARVAVRSREFALLLAPEDPGAAGGPDAGL